MNEMDKLAIAAGLQQMSAEDRALFKETAGEIVDILEEQFTVVDESNIDKVLKIDHPETYEDDLIPPGRPKVTYTIDDDVAKAIDATDADAVGIQHRQWPKGAERSGENDEKFQKVGTIASSKNSAALMAHLALQARQPGKNIDLGKALANDLMGDGGIREVERAIKNQYHPAVEHTITADKSKHHLNAAAGWSMMNPSAHQFMWVKFYGDDTEYTIDRAVRNYNGALQFTLSDQRVINVGAIDRHNTSLSLQNPKIRAIHIKSSRRY